MRIRINAQAVAFASLLSVAVAIFILLLVNTIQDNREKNTPVDVLQNWSLTVDSNKTYRPGDFIQVESRFDKLLNVRGDPVERYLQCYKPGTTEWDGLVLAVQTKGAQQPIKNGRSTYFMGIPINVGILPNTCRVVVTITYNVNPYHSRFLETTQSNRFTITPLAVDQLNNNQNVDTNPQSTTGLNSTYTIPYGLPESVIIQNNTPAETDREVAPPTTQQPNGFFENLLKPLTNVLNEIL